MVNYITIQLNGEPINCSEKMCLKDLLLYLGFDVKLIAIEYNSELTPVNFLDNIHLQFGDEIEVLSIIGGG